MLTDHQVDHFQTFGFVALPGLLGPARSRSLRDEVDTALRDAYAATYDERVIDGISGHYLPMASRFTPVSTSLICDEPSPGGSSTWPLPKVRRTGRSSTSGWRKRSNRKPGDSTGSAIRCGATGLPTPAATHDDPRSSKCFDPPASSNSPAPTSVGERAPPSALRFTLLHSA